MGKIRDIFKGEHKTFAWVVVISTAVFLVIWIVGPGNTFVHWAKAGLEIRRQEKQIERYSREIEEMDRRVNMLRNNRDTLEKFAREQFHFAVPGEDVYVVE